MVIQRSVVPWHDYTKTHWETGEGAGVTHLSLPYARETLCGLNKVNKPTTWEANGGGCKECADEYLVSVVVTAVRLTEKFTDGD